MPIQTTAQYNEYMCQLPWKMIVGNAQNQDAESDDGAETYDAAGGGSEGDEAPVSSRKCGNGETSKGGVAAAKETSSAKGHSNSSSDRGRDSKSSDREDMVRDRIGHILGF
jgi:hypothetical protein